MTLRYHTRQGKQIPTYVCQRDGIEKSEPICQTIPGRTLDAALGDLMLELMTPLTLDIALAVQEELEHRIEEVQELRQQHVKRAQFEVDLARRRYMEIDPGNRLVADSLEAEWNEKLRILAETRDEQERQSEQDRVHLDDEVRRKVHALTTDFPRVWRDPQTSDHDRKRMLRLLVSDVTLIKGEQIQAQVRLKGGAIRTLMVEKSLPAHEARKTDPEVVQEVDRHLDGRAR